jgi:hypothetical protein
MEDQCWPWNGAKISVLHYWFLHIAVDSLIELAEQALPRNRTKALRLQYRVDHPHVFGRSAQEGAVVH